MQIHVYKNAEEVCDALAAWITDLIDKTHLVKEKFTWALSGGETPKKLYQKLSSSPYKEKIKWDRIHFFWGDERVVPFDDERNNAKMAYDILLSKINIPSEHIHKIRTDIKPAEAAKQYEKTLHQYLDDKKFTFDLTLLGMGEDGHTLSLFPGSSILNDQLSWVNAVHSKEKGERITLMPSLVNRSSTVVFLVTGEKKGLVLTEVLGGKEQKYPAQLIQPSNKELHWFIDKEAAKYLTDNN
jgi:6-phosphogluconolactonase